MTDTDIVDWRLTAVELQAEIDRLRNAIGRHRYVLASYGGDYAAENAALWATLDDETS